MYKVSYLFILSILCVFANTVYSSEPLYKDTSASFEARAMDVVERMTLEEKVTQVGHWSEGIARLGIPDYNWWNECLHGVARAGRATVFPQAIGMASSFDRETMYEVASAISDEARAKHHEFFRNGNHGEGKGLTFWSPNINIFRDPRWGRGHETYGEDPYLTGQMGIEFVKGLQGDHPRYFKVIATAKHYAVHNGPEPERHHFNVVVNERDLWETYLPAFQDLVVDAKVYSVMGAFNRVDGVSASASWMLLEDILRNKWGFDGYVVSDCDSILDIFANHKIVDTGEEASAIGIRRGCDLNCGSIYLRFLKEAIEKGMIDESELDLAVYRLMLARMKLGMFDPPEMVPYAQIPYEVNECEKHDILALKMAHKSMTLLKNDGVLPLDKGSLKRLAVIGPNADSVEALLGNYHGEPAKPVTVLKGIGKAAGDNVKVIYKKASPLVVPDTNEDTAEFLAEAVKEATRADIVIFVGGLDALWEGEEMRDRFGVEGFNKGDRTKIELPELQLKALKAVLETGKPVVFVLMAGSCVSFEGLENDIDALLMAWYPGQRGGDAVADVLFGDYNPAGRLTVTFYESTDELGDFRDYAMASGKGQTYRYYKGEPMYGFGHGLSFTEFEYSEMKVSDKTIGSDDDFTVSVKVKNVGSRAGEEVVQLYVRDVKSERTMPVKQLRGFERISLDKNEHKRVVFELNAAEDLRYYDCFKQGYAVEPGEFEIEVGSSSEDIRAKETLAVK